MALLAGASLVAACRSSVTTPQAEFPLKLAPVSDLSPALRQLSPEIQEANRFALVNHDILEKIPCYCGCNKLGHMDNYMCCVQPGSSDGQVVLDYHAAD